MAGHKRGILGGKGNGGATGYDDEEGKDADSEFHESNLW
jgi:hypothetical protein